MNISSGKVVEEINGTAFLRSCVIAPRKMRMVADLIRGMNVITALNILKCEQKKCSVYFSKLILSAMANYQRKCELKKIENLDTKELVISTLKVDGKGMLKRLLPAPQGRAFRIRRRLSNVTVVLSKKNVEVKKKIKEKTSEKKNLLKKKVTKVKNKQKIKKDGE